MSSLLRANPRLKADVENAPLSGSLIRHGLAAWRSPQLTKLGGVSWYEEGEKLRLTLNENDFAPERDFGLLLSELVRFLKTETPKRIK